MADNCRQVIDAGHPLSVEAVDGTENLVFEVHCSQADVGLIIGRNGKTIEAIRTIVRGACRGASLKTFVDVVQSRCSTQGEHMKHFGLTLTTLVSLVVLFCGFLLRFGEDPWLMTRIVALSVPNVAYVVVADWALTWAMNVSEGAARRKMNWWSLRYVWHGVPVVLCFVLVAIGSVVLLFAAHVQRWLGGAS